jgi:transcription antitermination factor NusG
LFVASHESIHASDHNQDQAAGHEWYAIRVKSRCEKMVSEQLQQKGYEPFLPMYWSRRLWTDRVKVLQLPLFTGYLFCRFDIEKRLGILRTPGVVNILGRGREPMAVDPRQVEAVRLAITSGQSVKPWTSFEVGQRVRVELGPLRGVIGTLLRYKNESQLILQVDLMQRAMAVEVDETWVVPCDQAAPVVREEAYEMVCA